MSKEKNPILGIVENLKIILKLMKAFQVLRFQLKVSVKYIRFPFLGICIEQIHLISIIVSFIGD